MHISGNFAVDISVVALNTKVENYLGYNLPIHRPWPTCTGAVSVSSKWMKLILLCFDNFRGPAVRKSPSIDHLNLKQKFCQL